MKADTGVYQFDEIVINPADFQALRAGVRLEIEPKSFKVLMYLIENRERVVSKDELIEKVWSGTAVTDNALTRVIAQLRRELHDDARQPRYLETVPTVGYRFIGKLTEPPAFQTATLSEDRSVITRRKWALLLLGIPALVFGILLWGSKRLALQPSNRPPEDRSVYGVARSRSTSHILSGWNERRIRVGPFRTVRDLRASRSQRGA